MIFLSGTDAVIISDFNSMSNFVDLYADDKNIKGLIGAKVLIVEPSFSMSTKPLQDKRKTVLRMFIRILRLWRHLKMDVIVITNYPQEIIPEISKLTKYKQGDIVNRLVGILNE